MLCAHAINAIPCLCRRLDSINYCLNSTQILPEFHTNYPQLLHWENWLGGGGGGTAPLQNVIIV